MQLPDRLSELSAHFSPLLWNVILGTTGVLIGLVIRLILHWVLNFYTRHSSHIVFKSIVKNLKGPANFFVPLFFLNLVIPFMELTKTEGQRFDKAVEIGLIISFAMVLIGFVNVFEEVMYNRYDLKKADNLRERKVRTQLQFVRQMVVVTIIMLTAAAILLSFENLRKIGAGLLTSVGIGGIIIGFAAQSSLSNLLAGFQIAFTQPMRIDDGVVVEGEYGNVEEITLTYVVVRIWDQRRLVLPIRYFIEKPFQNWTRTTSEILGTAFFYLDFSIPVEELRKEFNRLIESSPLWDKRVRVLQVTDMKEKSVEVRTLASARNSSDAFDLRCYIRENLMLFIQKNYPESFPKNRSEVINANNNPIPENPGDLAKK